jgi:hypothetical protein
MPCNCAILMGNVSKRHEEFLEHRAREVHAILKPYIGVVIELSHEGFLPVAVFILERIAESDGPQPLGLYFPRIIKKAGLDSFPRDGTLSPVAREDWPNAFNADSSASPTVLAYFRRARELKWLKIFTGRSSWAESYDRDRRCVEGPESVILASSSST